MIMFTPIYPELMAMTWAGLSVPAGTQGPMHPHGQTGLLVWLWYQVLVP